MPEQDTARAERRRALAPDELRALSPPGRSLTAGFASIEAFDAHSRYFNCGVTLPTFTVVP